MDEPAAHAGIVGQQQGGDLGRQLALVGCGQCGTGKAEVSHDILDGAADHAVAVAYLGGDGRVQPDHAQEEVGSRPWRPGQQVARRGGPDAVDPMRQILVIAVAPATSASADRIHLPGQDARELRIGRLGCQRQPKRLLQPRVVDGMVNQDFSQAICSKPCHLRQRRAALVPVAHATWPLPRLSWSTRPTAGPGRVISRG